MSKNWKTYCIMCAIIYIEEMSKPTKHIQIKKYKNIKYKCLCFHSLRLKMKDPEFVNKFFKITKTWERKKKIKLIGKTFKKPRKENQDGQDVMYLSPVWINYILAELGEIPNKYSYDTAIKRIEHFKQYKKIPIKKEKNSMNLLMKNKKIAAGAFIVSLDLEFRGVCAGKPSLCMSEKYKDFLNFMLKVAQKWNWTNNKTLSPVSVEYSIKRGINASPQYELRINMKGLKEIYNLAGPLINSHKNKCINFNVKRSENYTPQKYHIIKNKSKEKILNTLKNKNNMTTTELQFITGTGTDVVLIHLKDLEKIGKVKKERRGKRYIWNIK